MSASTRSATVTGLCGSPKWIPLSPCRYGSTTILVLAGCDVPRQFAVTRCFSSHLVPRVTSHAAIRPHLPPTSGYVRRMHTVAILGGGVGGLSAAHELSTRGFDVHVYEMRDAFGGKARSIDVPDTPTGERKPLPGEHGFRFFPGFYQHIILTMQDIPSGSGKTVKDHLVRATRILIAQAGKRNELVDTTEFPSTIPDLAVLAQFIWDYALAVRVSPIDVAYFLQRMLTLLLSCDERRKQQWDLLSWWDFIAAEERSEKYRKFLADGMTRTLVAAQAKLMSARTGGLIAWQIVFDMARVGNRADQVLDGPTSEVWIKPWVDYLQTAPRDVKFHKNREVTEIHCRNGVITEVTVTEVEHTGTRTERTGKTETVKADYYVSAMPVERLDPLVTPEMRAADPQLTKLKRLITRWMNGVIFYLDQNVRLERGHVLFVDSEWALTAISQAQFWRRRRPLEVRRRQGPGSPLRRRVGLVQPRASHREVRDGVQQGRNLHRSVGPDSRRHRRRLAGRGERSVSVHRPRHRVPESLGGHQRGTAPDQHRGLVDGPTRRGDENPQPLPGG